jgi:YidC/Oxa1 family membrane protein insertase
MRRIQPQLKEIKKQTKGNRQQESLMTMALYKEHGVSPFGSIGIVLLQLPILLGLYSGLNKLIHDNRAIVDFAYPALQHMSWLEHLSKNIHQFDSTLFGVVDLTRSALGTSGVYWPAMLIVVGSAIIQYYQSKQLTPTDNDARKLRDILKSAGDGKEADQSEVNAAVSRTTIYLIPAMILLFTVHIASALSLYWLVGGLVAFIQQSIILREDKTELAAIASSKPSGKGGHVIEGEVVNEPATASKSKKGSSANRKKRKKR